MKRMNILTLIIPMFFTSCIDEPQKTVIEQTPLQVEKPAIGRSDQDSLDLKLSDDCLLLQTYISYIKDDEKLDSIIVADEYINWDIDWHLDFDAEGQSLPKNKKDREKRLSGENIFDPYPFTYIYSHFESDSIFSPQDRTYIRKQAQITNRKIECNLKNVQFVEKFYKSNKKMGFFPPLYSKDHNYAILRAFIYYEVYEDSYTGIVQTMYYKRGVRGWENIFKSSKRIL